MRALSSNVFLASANCRWRGWMAAFFASSLALASQPVLAAEAPDNTTPAFRSDRILIKPRTAGDLEQKRTLQRFHTAQGVQVFREFHHLDGIQDLQLPPGRDVSTVIRQYQESGLVEFAEPDLRLTLAATPNDPAFASGLLWHLNNLGQNSGKSDADIDAPEGWDLANTASNVVVATVDSGVRYTHEDLAANIWINPREIPGNGVDDDANGFIDDVHGINAAANTGDPIDLIGHGTQVAGFIGGVGNNGIGIAGVAWRVRLMACRFQDDSGTGFLSDAAQCIDYALANGAQIINGSFVTTSFSSVLYNAMNNCRIAGVIFVAAAGNDGVNTDVTPYYPAGFNFDNIVAVAASTRTDALATFSNYGAVSVDLAAPGQDVYSTFNSADNGYTVNSGTSFASPIVAGAFALLRARNPSATYHQLIQQVLATVDPLPGLAGKCVSGGRLNLVRALGTSTAANFVATPPAGTTPLTVSFVNTSFGLFTNSHWDFGDGTFSNESDPAHTYVYEGLYNVQLTVSGNDGLVSSTNKSVAVVPDYLMLSTPIAWINPSTMPALNLVGDGVSRDQSLPFAFKYFGQYYTSVYVGANGVVGFSSQNLSAASNTDLPNASAPNNVMCPYWDDLNPTSTSVRMGIVGVAPDRRAVISWVSVPAAGGGPPAAFTFQVILEETSNEIVFQYLEVRPTSNNSSAGGRSATIGIEDSTGWVARKYSFNGSAPLGNNQALRFIPSGQPPAPVIVEDPRWDGNHFTFSFLSRDGAPYSIQFASSLTASAWQTFTNVIGSGALMTISDPNSTDTARFYRVESR
jgi:subtilisin family serine protease